MDKLTHIDMDAFYISIEQSGKKELKEKRIIVSGDLQSRCIVAPCSYEAELEYQMIEISQLLGLDRARTQESVN